MTQTVLIGDICTKVTSGGTPSTKHDEYYGGDIPWLRTQEVNFGNIYSTEKTITEAGLKNSSAKLIPKNSVIIAMYGATAGKSAINKIPLTTNQACCNLIIDNKKADYRYVYYYLSSNYENLLKSATGAAQQNLGAKQISAMSIELPDLETQKKIADILGTIDEKIELNRRMNETLEQMGQALFRHYFIDNPEAENWENGIIADLGEVITGKTPRKVKSEYYGDDVMFLKVPDMHSNSIIIKTEDKLSYLGADSQPGKYIPKWSTCVSCIATVGVISLVGDRLQTNQQINSIVPKSKNHTLFNYYLMKSKSEILKTMASGGSTTSNLNKGHFESIKIKLPPAELLEKFQDKTENLLNIVDENTQQIQTLTTLRDTLLPQLISGKVEV